jgi:creatinine amidohydrolase
VIMGGAKKHFEMSWTEFEATTKEKDFVFLPIGAIEQHGPHLPMGTDVIIGEYLCEKLAHATGGVLLHSLAYTPSFSLRLYPGTVRVTDETFASTIVEIANALYQHGIKFIYAFIAHLGAVDACKAAERELLLHSQARLIRLVLPGYNEAIERYCTSERWHATYVHAEEFETSMILAIRPELVDMKKAVREYPKRDPLFGPISMPWNTFCESGVIGDATVATAETGRKILEHLFQESLAIVKYHQDSIRSQGT